MSGWVKTMRLKTKAESLGHCPQLGLEIGE